MAKVDQFLVAIDSPGELLDLGALVLEGLAGAADAEADGGAGRRGAVERVVFNDGNAENRRQDRSRGGTVN